nr:CvpA family protein [uncultured Blautia sp.]
MNVTWLGIVVLAILILCVWRGYRRGFIKEIVSFFFVFLSLSLAWAINPYINEFLVQKTPIYNTIQETCTNFVQSQGEEKAEYETDSTGNLIDGLKLPDLLRKNLEENNNAETYAALSVDTMTEYVSGYLVRTVVNGLSYVLAYILSTIMIRLIAYVLNLIAGLPVLKTANKLTGGAVGFLKGIVFIWIAFLVLTVLCSTEIGKTALELIEKDTLLSTLYQYDPLVRIFSKIL